MKAQIVYLTADGLATALWSPGINEAITTLGDAVEVIRRLGGYYRVIDGGREQFIPWHAIILIEEVPE